jgi:small subunit ribosomal protein S19e
MTNMLASLARKIYLRPGIGITRLAHIYGGNAHYGSSRSHHAKSARNNLRKILIDLENADIIARVAPQDKEDVKLLPRKIAAHGQKSLNEIAKQVFNNLLTGSH